MSMEPVVHAVSVACKPSSMEPSSVGAAPAVESTASMETPATEAASVTTATPEAAATAADLNDRRVVIHGGR